MARKFYVSKVVGSGATPADARRPKAIDYLLNDPTGTFVSYLRLTPQGQPKRSWAVVRIDTSDLIHGQIASDPDCHLISTDDIYKVLTNPQRRNLLDKLVNLGVTDDLTGFNRPRDIIRRLCRIQEPIAEID